MAKLTLKIIGDNSDALNKIEVIKTALKDIGKSKINFSVQASGLDAIAARLKEISEADIAAANATAKANNAIAKRMAEERKAASTAEKLSAAQQKQAQSAQAAAQATDRLALSNEQIRQKMESNATQTEMMRRVAEQLYAQYIQIAQAAIGVTSGQDAMNKSMGLSIVRVGALNERLREMVNLFLQAKGFSSGSFATPYTPNNMPNLGGNAGENVQGGALSTYVNPYNYYSAYEPNWIFGSGFVDAEVIDVTPIENIGAALENTSASATHASAAFTTMRDGMRTAWQTMNEGTPVADALGDSIGNIIVKITTWQVVNGIVANIKRAFKDALDTMREVDQQLTNIQKVSDLTAKDIARIGDSAYETASKYGVAAEEYLSAVYTFQKAGLGDSAEKMGELAVKTMLVGDTTADVATKFIIATNAAWKYGGSVEELSRLVDEADKLNNTYAVSLQDIAEGLPIVAATAAQAGMTAEQTMSAISTIVASTGQSATKAATALRAIIMNLIGETGELDDGLSVTEETVASLNSVLNKYARASLEAAEAEGKILDPMEAIAALAQAAEDGFLNEAQLFEVLSGLGGKLRTTQLTALVNAQEMYNSMLKDTADAAGTADREISIMLESWNSKTQILTNTFTQFISHLVDSKGIKAGIDLLTKLVEVLDSGVGKFAALTVAVFAAAKAFTMLATTGLGATLVSLASGFITVGEAVTVLSTTILSSALFWAAAIAGVILLIDKLIVTTQEHAENVEKSVEEYENLQKQVDELNDKIDENKGLIEKANEAGRDDAYTKRLENENRQLEIQIELLEIRARKEKENAHDEAIAGLKAKSYQIGTGRYEDYTVVNGSDVTTSQVEIFESGNILQYVNYLLKLGRAGQDVSASLSDAYDTLVTFQKGLDTSTTEGKVYAQAIATAIEYIGAYTGSLTRNTKDLQDNTNAKTENAGATEEVTSSNTALQKAFEEVDKKGALTYGTLKELNAIYPGLSAKILDVNGNLTAEGAAAMSSRAALYELISSMITANTTALNFDAQIAALQQLATEAGVAAGSISAVFAAANMGAMVAGGTGDWDDIANMTQDQVARYRASSASNQMLALIRKQIKDQQTISGPGGGGGGGGSEEDPTEIELNRLKEVVNLRKQELSYIKESRQVQSEYDNLLAEALALGADLNKTVYGNIDTNARQILDWNEENIERFWEEIKSWGMNPDDLYESISTVLGSAEEFDGVEIAFSPILQTEDGPVLLSSDTVYEYIWGLIDKAGEGWTNEQLFALDTEGLVFNGQLIKNLLADIGETAIQTSQVMHYMGKDGALAGASHEILSNEELQIQKMREVQDALHEQAEYMRSIGADEKDILALSTEWWKIENDIVETQDKISKQLREEIADAIDDIGDALENASDAMVAPLQAQLDALTAAHDATEERREEEEKIAAVQEKQLELEKARIALENAQNERTVRQYNAKTGQWEWVANAKNVESAQESLKKAEEDLFDAQTDLAKYYADQAYEAQKAVLEKQIKATKEAFTSFRNTIKEASDAVKDGEMDIDEAYDYISAEMKRIYDEYGIDLTDTLKDIISGFGNVSGAIGELYAKILAMLGASGKEGKGDKEGGGKSEQFIGAMSNIYFDARERGDAETMAAANRAANEERGMGSVITAVEDVALISAQSSGKSIADYSADYMAARAAGDYSAMEVANRAANILRGNGNVVTAGDDINKVRIEGGYDYGGILTGMGGIKATEHDEMVLPPDMTRVLLDAERSGAFDSLLQHLGIVTSAANGIAGFGGVMSSDRIGEQHNGDIISINGIELRNVTENTTLGELTRMAKNLALVKGS